LYELLGFLPTVYMRDQGVEMWPVFGGKDFEDGILLECMGCQPIDGLGGDSYQLACPQQTCCMVNI
jgi:hypothetical protein